MKYTSLRMKSASKPAPARARKLYRGHIKEELVALIKKHVKNGDAIDAVILDYMIECQCKIYDREAYIAQERAKLERVGKLLEIEDTRGWFWKSAAEIAKETCLGLVPSTIGLRLEKLATADLFHQRDPEGSQYTTKWYLVSIVEIDQKLRAIGYHLESYFFDKHINPDGASAEESGEKAEGSSQMESSSPFFESESPFSNFENGFSKFEVPVFETKDNHISTSLSTSTNNNSNPARAEKIASVPVVAVVNSSNQNEPTLPATATVAVGAASAPKQWPSLRQRLFDLGVPESSIARQLDQWPESKMSVNELHLKLRDLGVGSKRAIVQADADLVRWQLILWPSRPQARNGYFKSEGGTQAGSPGGALRAAIWGGTNSEGDWAPDTKWTDAILRSTKAQTNKAASMARQAAEEAAARAETLSVEQQTAQLDEAWERLPQSERDRLEAEAIDRLGVLGRSGRAQGALIAMRRNLLREELEAAPPKLRAVGE